jgi:hypothetical protein
VSVNEKRRKKVIAEYRFLILPLLVFGVMTSHQVSCSPYESENVASASKAIDDLASTPGFVEYVSSIGNKHFHKYPFIVVFFTFICTSCPEFDHLLYLNNEFATNYPIFLFLHPSFNESDINNLHNNISIPFGAFITDSKYLMIWNSIESKHVYGSMNGSCIIFYDDNNYLIADINELHDSFIFLRRVFSFFETFQLL